MDEAVAAAPTKDFDAQWGRSYVSPDVFVRMAFTSLIQRQCKSVAASLSGAENNSHRGMESQSAIVVLSEAPGGLSMLIVSPGCPLRFLCQAREASWVRTRAKQFQTSLTNAWAEKFLQPLRNLHWVRSAAYTIPTRSRCFSFLK